MKKVILFALSVICVLMILSGCGGSSKLTGVWTEIDGEGILYFAEDNTGLSANVAYTSASFEYEEKEAKLTFIAETTAETDYTVESDVLTITIDGRDYLYERVKLSEGEINEYLADHGIEIEVSEESENYSDATSVIPGDEIPSVDDEPSEDDMPENSSDTSSDIPDDETPSVDDEPSEDDIPENSFDEAIKESIIGAWKGGDGSVSMVYVFYEDGTGAAAIIPFTYTVENGVLSIEMSVNGEILKGSGRYESDGDCLYIENNNGAYILHRTEMPEIPNIPNKG